MSYDENPCNIKITIYIAMTGSAFSGKVSCALTQVFENSKVCVCLVFVRMSYDEKLCYVY
jgi:hypothetical protein